LLERKSLNRYYLPYFREQYEVVSRKAEKREKSREAKAEKAALIDRHIKEELLQNLKTGKYNEIYNLDEKQFNKILDKEEVEEELENDFEEDAIEDLDNIFVADAFGDDAEEGDNNGNEDYGDDEIYNDSGDIEDIGKSSKSLNTTSSNKGRKLTGNKTKRNKMKMNYEVERESENINEEMHYN
jgi:protein MAK16